MTGDVITGHVGRARDEADRRGSSLRGGLSPGLQPPRLAGPVPRRPILQLACSIPHVTRAHVWPCARSSRVPWLGHVRHGSHGVGHMV